MSPTVQIAWNSVKGIWHYIVAILPSIAVAAVVFGVFLLIARAVRWAARSLAHRASHDQFVGELFARLGGTATVVAGFFVAAAIVFPSITPQDLFAGLGVTSVAIGFAFKDILQNFLAGILLMLRKPFRLGDEIVTGEFGGVVEDINIRATLLRTYAGERIVVPNSVVYTNPVKVLTAFDFRRSELVVGIGYADDVEEARRVITKAVRALPTIAESPAIDVYTVELAPSSVNLKVRYWTASDIATVRRAESAVATAVKYALDEAHIDMPFPQTVVHFGDGAPLNVAAAPGQQSRDPSH